MQFTNSTSFSVVEKLLSNIQSRHGAGVIKEIFIDNCCQWRNKLQSIFGNETKVYLDLFHAVQRVSRVLSKKNPLYSKCIEDLRLVFRSPGDVGVKRHFPTPSSEVLLENADNFLTKWSKIQHNGLLLLNDKAVNEVEKLKEHIRKGCLSNIGVGCGTNRNEALHRHLNSFFHRSRISTLLAYAFITVLLFSHNSSVENTSKKIVKPISACIALQYKLAYEKYPEPIAKNVSEHIGIAPKQLDQSIEIVYSQTLPDDNDETIFDSETSNSILYHAVQQAIVLNSMKSINNQLNKLIGMYSNLFGCVQELFHKEQTESKSQGNLLDNLLESNNLERMIVPGNGNCCFLSVAQGLKVTLEGKNADHPLISHLNTVGVNWHAPCEELSQHLRELTVKEWLSNQSYYQSFLETSSDIEVDATRFLDQTHFENSLGDTMILAMSNVFCTPIIIFSTLQNNSIIPVMPRSVIGDALILVAYNSMGAGHYDAVIPKQFSGKTKVKVDELHCRCGVNGNTTSCLDQKQYRTRCACYKMKQACTTACKCKNCSNTFGKRPFLGKRTRQSHSHQISLPNSKQFIVDRSEQLIHGPWTSLENSIFLFIIEYFQLNSKEMTVESVLKGFNEIVMLSTSDYSCVDIPDCLMKPAKKSYNQMSSKLKHYLNEITIINECAKEHL